MMATSDPLANQKAACATYIEQTKLLVTLASAFVLAPPGFAAFLKDRIAAGLDALPVWLFIVTEGLFMVSVLSGYVVLGSIVGSQNTGTFDVYRRATRVASLIQFGSYLGGLILFVSLVANVLL